METKIYTKVIDGATIRKRRTNIIIEKDDMQKLLLGVVGALPKEPDDSRYGVSVCKCLFRKQMIPQNVRNRFII